MTKKNSPLEDYTYNYDANSARIIGFMIGAAKAYANVLKQDRPAWSKEEIADKMLQSVAIADKWFDVRYEKIYSADDIVKMLDAESQDPSDLVELERA
jgi:hypothetical protein